MLTYMYAVRTNNSSIRESNLTRRQPCRAPPHVVHLI